MVDAHSEGGINGNGQVRNECYGVLVSEGLRQYIAVVGILHKPHPRRR